MLKIKLLPKGEIKEVEPLKISEFYGEKIFFYKDQETEQTICSDFETGTRLFSSTYKTLKFVEKAAYDYLLKKKDQYLELKDKIRKGDGGYYKIKIINQE